MKKRAILSAVAAMAIFALGATARASDLAADFQQPPASARPWVFWYWMQASVSRAGITADLEAMKEAGVGGAYLMPIKDAATPPHIDPPIAQLSPAWWEMVRHAMSEADRLGLKLAMHASDGFAVAGGPWITPELSMQKVVWSETRVAGGQRVVVPLPAPAANEGYYRDVAVFAFPTPAGDIGSTRNITPRVTTSRTTVVAQYLAEPDNKETFRSEDPCWIQYEFAEPFTCRSIKIRNAPTNAQGDRFHIDASDDGTHFRPVTQLEPPRHGWQNGDADATHAIEPTTARFFRFNWEKTGTEPGAEDLDSAKWRPILKVQGIELSSTPRLHQFEGKTGAVWRVSPVTTAAQLPDALCVSPDKIVTLTGRLDAQGRLQWDAPAGEWTILRMGHTSTGHRNETGGAGRGLECDKFNPVAVRLQFDRWYGEAIRQAGPELAGRVLKVFHVDSWECGSQNWSPVFREEFTRRRGYDPLPWLPAMAGVAIKSAAESEKFLHDVRATISELMVDNFFGTLAGLAKAQGCTFSAECTAPTMTGDALAHFAAVDVPMGEFWLRSPTHDKPNDMLDAISGAHIYGKPLVQAEAFTELRMAWDEHPGMLKALGDRNYALGINRFVYHVFAHNPWLDRRPGMTLDGVGLYFQRDQTWWKTGRAWVDYTTRCQALLQRGTPVVDVAVFTGEEIPSRAVRPEQLVVPLPGVVGAAAVAREAKRLANKNEPVRELPDGVMHSANLVDPADWIDPLRGYAYDSINRDALLRLATVRNGRIELPGGASYGALVIRDKNLSPEMSGKVNALTAAGAKVIRGVFREESFESLGIARDFTAAEINGTRAEGIAWTHRTAPEGEIYFVSNQQASSRELAISLRTTGRVPELWNAVTGEIRRTLEWRVEDGRTILPVRLEASGSVFVVLREAAGNSPAGNATGKNWREFKPGRQLDGAWQVMFEPINGRPVQPIVFDELEDWGKRSEAAIHFYSGTAVYEKTFTWRAAAENGKSAARIWLDLGRVANLAEVSVNGTACGIVWTPPYRVDVTSALRSGENRLRVAVTNTWANRLIGDRELPVEQRVTRTTAPDRLQDRPLLEAGLRGPVALVEELAPTGPQASVSISPAEMQRVYDEVKTPFKHGVVLKGVEGEMLDCPNVFRHGGRWYMMYVAIRDKVGYETFLARSDDLLNWEKLGRIMSFRKERWDAWQADGGLALYDHRWNGTHELGQHDGKYWLSYIGGALQGYEPDPLAIGLAWTKTPAEPAEWTRLAENPILSTNDPDVRPFESVTLYKSAIIRDEAQTLGAPFVMFYNGKTKQGNHEAIGMAVSQDMLKWQRYGAEPVVDNGPGKPAISGDPQITKMGDLWVMFYFGFRWKPNAFDTFACSRDLVNWTKWEGPHLVEPSEPYDKPFAHKPWVMKHDGVVYHFYCALGKEGRVIALATSKDLRPPAAPTPNPTPTP
ncbi:MAG TPA: glycosyl hydrolase [Opitutaceae bacterium]|nr:glycosyl hydrolase [Opitutaceae bacterium]